jgi:plastocyanin
MEAVPLRSARLTALLALLLSLPFPAWAVTWVVTVGDNFFSNPQGNGPGNLTIQVGDTVRWENPAGGNPHNVTSDTGAWAPSPTASSWAPFEVTFNSAGEFDYRCTVHPATMTGTITVVDAAAQAELAVQSVAAEDGDFFAGEFLTINTVIQNSGDAASGAFTITFYASADSDITAADHMLGSAQVSDIGAGGNADREDEVSVPEGVPPGDYFIGAIITFSDGNSADNRNFDAATVTFLGVFLINAGLNDAWFNIATSGQGFFFTVFPDVALFFLSWFTFDTELPDGSTVAIIGYAGHRWVTALGPIEPGNSVTLDVTLSVGGLFDSPDPEVEHTAGYGTITITFINCNEAILDYSFPGLGLSGSITLTRITTDNVALCKALIAELQ